MKLTKSQIENGDIKQKSLTALKNIGRPVTVAELKVGAPSLTSYSPNKLSALVNQLVDEGSVGRKTEKKT